MRAGKLDRTITIQAPGDETVDAHGTPSRDWTDLATVRAEIIQASTKEALKGYGETDTAAIVFRTRYVASVTLDCQVIHEGHAFNLREVTEIGRRRGLELRCEVARS